ncbi:MAG TPA: SLAP domain-containing protein [Bacillaceae bacterium]
MTNYKLHLHPMWEKALSREQKMKYAEMANSKAIQPGTLTVTEILANFKENGGFVATILLNNGYNEPLNIQKTAFEVADAQGETIAKGRFEPNLDINPFSSQPWSFVFSKEMVFREGAGLAAYSVRIELEEYFIGGRKLG